MGEGIKEKLGSSLSIFNRLRIQVSHGSIIAFAALVMILFVAFTVRILPLRWENLSGGTALLNEFDPYYQFSITQHMVNNGLLSPYWPTHWINLQKWYPDGIDMATSLPALPMTAAVLFQVVSLFGAKIDLMTFTSILPAVIAVVSCLVLYFIGKDMGGKAVGLFAALFLALAPSFLQRSSLGFFDTEVPGVLGLVLFIFLFLRSVDSNRSLRASLMYSLGAGGALAYFISGWGAAYYLIALSVLFVFVMVLLKRYSQRLLINYSITFGLALFIGTKVPYISLGYLSSAAILPVAAVFIVLVVAEILRNNISMKTKLTLALVSLVGIVGGFIALAATGLMGSITGKFITVLNPFIRAASPLVDSVAEQKISAWGNLYLEFGIAILFFLVGLYFVLKNPTNRNVFLLLFAVTGLYFAASMVRLLVLFAPVFAIIAGIGIISVLKPFFNLLQEAPRALAKSKRRMARVSKEYSGVAVFVIFMILVTNLAFSPQTGGMPKAIGQAYVPTAISASSLPIGGASLNAPVSAWLDAVHWLQNNVRSTDAVVMWWDYGNWLADLGNVTSLADNTTFNSTQIENVGFIFMANENQSMAMLSNYGQSRVKYIAVFEVLQISQASSGSSYIASPAGYGDEGKWVWMARISGQAKTRLINEGYMNPATAWKDETQFGASNPQTGKWEWNDQGLNSTVFELLNYAEVDYANTITTATNNQITVSPDQTTTTPTYFQKAYFAGINTNPGQYGGLIPIIAIYKIDWASWDAAHGITPP
ncbi:MAG: glycosyltransferase family 39 protein [Chloroflexi bacterium]|nr:glycosyltransferase family 39 protein [Chloroflexota bacterium]MCL5949011.1 glycosyltransferase family 39 protein [Candidatus Bathyarchaeota archaeon]